MASFKPCDKRRFGYTRRMLSQRFGIFRKISVTARHLATTTTPSSQVHFAWATDTHFDNLKRTASNFADRLNRSPASFMIHSGDITASAVDTFRILSLLSKAVTKPFYYVMGNHDYYSAKLSILDIRKHIIALQDSANTNLITWLPSVNYIPINQTTALIGIDGFSDSIGSHGSNGILDFNHSDVNLKLTNESPISLFARADSLWLQIKLDLAYRDGFRHFIVITHIPPYPEAACDRKKLNADGSPLQTAGSALPFYTSSVAGDTITAFLTTHPGTSIEVFCGHTHKSFYYQHPTLAVTVNVGDAYSKLKPLLVKSTPQQPHFGRGCP